MLRCWIWPLGGVLLASLALSAAGADWYARVKLKGVKDASAEDVALHEKGQLPDSLHVGDCYYHLERWAEGIEVFRRLRSRPDRNYAAAAMVREAEGLVKLDHRARARAQFARCLEEFPEAYLDVDIPALCRAWIKEIGDVGPAEPGASEKSDPGPRTREDETSTVRQEIRRLEEEIAEIRKRIADLKQALAAGD